MKIRITVLICILNVAYSSAFESVTTLIIRGTKINQFQLNIEDQVSIKNLKESNLIKKNVTEPLRVCITNSNDTIAINNHSVKTYFLYLDIGKHIILIDLDKQEIYSKTSKTNTEYNELWKIKRTFDTLQYYANKRDSLKLSQIGFINQYDADSISKLYHNTYLQKCLTMPNSFLSLRFLSFISKNYNQIGISKEDVLRLYNSIGKSIQKYPTYSEVKKYINEHILNIGNTPNNLINSPLWTPQ